MRRPTPIEQQLAWWRNAITTGNQHRTEEPECGYYKVRKERRSREWLPARIWLHQSMDWETGELMEPEKFVLEIAGSTVKDETRVRELSLWLRPVTLDEWKWLTARQALHGTRLRLSTSE